jgi:hypothetical protein
VTRPRIRTLKPEMWADEKIGALSRDARLLFVGLITMADDAGRFRALPSAILGHVFPYDEDAAKKLDRWMGEIESQGLVQRYTVPPFLYGVLPGWLKHQKINRATESTLPPPPSWNGHGEITEPSWIAHDPTCGRAQADRIRRGSGINISWSERKSSREVQLHER